MANGLTRIGLALLAAGLSVWILWWLRGMLFPFILAIAIAYVLEPVVAAVEHRNVSRQAAVVGVFAAIAILLFVIARFLLPAVMVQLQTLIEALPELIVGIQQLLNRIQSGLQGTIGPRLFDGPVTDALDVLEEWSQNVARTIVLSVPLVFTTVAYSLLAPFLAYYILRDSGVIKKRIRSTIPERHRTEVLRFLGDIDRALAGYVRGQILVAGIVGALTAFGLLVLGVPFALVLGIIAGVFEIVPYFGPWLGAGPAVLVALLTSNLLAAKVGALFFVIQQAESLYISPRVIGGRVGLHPLAVIFVLLVGGRLMGIVGVLLAVPVTVVVRVIVTRFPRSLLSWGNRQG